MTDLLTVTGLTVTYAAPARAGSLGTGAALRGVDLTVREGEILGVVGETGSGKTTLARAAVGLVRPAAGRIDFAGAELGSLRGRTLRDFRRTGQLQLAFQDPLRALDGDLSVRDVVAEPLDVAGDLSRREREERVAEALAHVGLDLTTYGGRMPRQLSGGQRQRVSLARAIVTRPRLLFCDEPVSALDVSNRNLVLRLLDRLRHDLGLAVVIIAHDLSSLAGIADRVAVFYRGRLVEAGPIGAVLRRPAHPYTALLTASAPSVRQEGRLHPDQLRRPAPEATHDVPEDACVFAARCRFAHDACSHQPPLADAPDQDGAGHRQAACHVADRWRSRLRAGPTPDAGRRTPRRPHPPEGSSNSMTIEFIGYAGTREYSESMGYDASAPAIDPDHVGKVAATHEASGFDRVLIAHSSSSPDGFILADQVLSRSTSLAVLLAHRPGFLAPTLAARAYATLEAFHPGRVAMHVITGGDDADQARDGDFTDKATRYARTDDFLSVVRKEWYSEKPFDHRGDFYRVAGGWSSVRPPSLIPVYFGGASEDAVRVGGKHADVYAFWGEPLAGIAERIAQVRAAAAPYGRSPRFSVSLRPIVADTEHTAWQRADEVLEQARARAGSDTVGSFRGLDHSKQHGSQRLLEVAAQGDVHDKRLWTAVAKVTGAAGNSTALVGSYEQVAESLLDYVDLGVTTLLIRGFSPLADAAAYGPLIELVRAGAVRRTATSVPA